jgi:hypothetical protein
MKSVAFAQNRTEGVRATVSRRVDVETIDKTPDISTWQSWEYAMIRNGLEEGRFFYYGRPGGAEARAL